MLPAVRDTTEHVSRWLLRDWWNKAVKLAGLEPESGRGYHTMRRKFATELRHIPSKDLMSLGGWQDYRTILKCYQHPDMDAMRNALHERGESTHQPTHPSRAASAR